jgi:hypothetical protein
VQRAWCLLGWHRSPGREQCLRDQATAEGTPRLCPPAAECSSELPLIHRRQPELADQAAPWTGIGVGARIVRSHGKQYRPLGAADTGMITPARRAARRGTAVAEE